MNKKVLIGLGVLAVAGVAFYMWKKKQGEVSETETKTPETKANARGVIGQVVPNDVRVMCVPPRTLSGGGFGAYKCVGKGLSDEEPIYTA